MSTLPRFYERGPIEAKSPSAIFIVSSKLPRFYERGPIEASFAACSACCWASFRASMSAAPLKPLNSTLLVTFTFCLLPRFYERGPIEAPIGRPGRRGGGALPRFYERGPIEALSWGSI